MSGFLHVLSGLGSLLGYYTALVKPWALPHVCSHWICTERYLLYTYSLKLTIAQRWLLVVTMHPVLGNQYKASLPRPALTLETMHCIHSLFTYRQPHAVLSDDNIVVRKTVTSPVVEEFTV